MVDKILIVDDDLSICKLLEKVVHNNDLEATVADNGQAAPHLLKDYAYDTILMDMMLRGMESFEAIRALWSQGTKTPVVIVSGRSEDHDSLYGLSIGADDYITKPFRPLALGAKAKALIRRSRNLSSNSPDQLERGPFSYNTFTMRLYKDDGEIFLSSKEDSLVLLFMKHPGQIFTKEVIYEHVWDNIIAADDNTIMVYISRLRSKIEEDRQKPAHIMTVRGPGYRFVP